MSKKYRKRPVEIEAVQFTYNSLDEVNEFIDENYYGGIEQSPDKPPHLIIETDEGNHHAIEGDWIIKGVNNEFYPCKSDVFHQTYERVEDN